MLGLLWLTLVPVAGVGGLGGGAGGGDLRETGGERDDDERRLVAGAGEVEERGGVSDRAAHNMLLDETTPRLPTVGGLGDAAAGWFEAEEAAGARWDPDAPASVSRVREGDNPRGDRRGRTPA